jgi:hypothetical protein
MVLEWAGIIGNILANRFNSVPDAVLSKAKIDGGCILADLAP